jgi:hypothetical protein
VCIKNCINFMRITIILDCCYYYYYQFVMTYNIYFMLYLFLFQYFDIKNPVPITKRSVRVVVWITVNHFYSFTAVSKERGLKKVSVPIVPIFKKKKSIASFLKYQCLFGLHYTDIHTIVTNCLFKYQCAMVSVPWI